VDDDQPVKEAPHDEDLLAFTAEASLRMQAGGGAASSCCAIGSQQVLLRCGSLGVPALGDSHAYGSSRSICPYAEESAPIFGGTDSHVCRFGRTGGATMLAPPYSGELYG
jgi:hypothetical protein